MLINNLKTASARRTRNRFAAHLAHFYSKPLFWHRAYFVGSVGGATGLCERAGDRRTCPQVCGKGWGFYKNRQSALDPLLTILLCLDAASPGRGNARIWCSCPAGRETAASARPGSPPAA
ncbi:transposase [Pantoea sp. 18069]|uniref:transposase n=1 Tax=Pantoea sp. 18069 TaxID=2681415 RepID=UPI001F23409F|nr:transposase [Pantoea sp. 18069]